VNNKSDNHEQKESRRQRAANGKRYSKTRIVARVSSWAGRSVQAMAWYRAEPVPTLGGRTAESLPSTPLLKGTNPGLQPPHHNHPQSANRRSSVVLRFAIISTG
jgi:hypothetical protein